MNVSNNLNNLNKLSFGELKTFAQLNSAGNGNVNNANSKYNNAVNNTNATNTASSNTPKLQEQVKEDTVVLFGKEVKKKNLAIGASIIGGISIVATLISVLGRGKAIAGEDAKLVEKLKEGFKAKFTLSGRKNYNEIINNNNKNNKVTNNNNGSVNNANNNVNDNSVNNSKTNEGNVNNNGNDTKLQSPETPTENKLENKLEKEQENNPLSQTPAESDTPKTPTGSQTQEGLSTNKEGVKDTAASETPKTSETPGVGNNDATSQQLEAKEIDLGNKTQYSDANRAAQELKQTGAETPKGTPGNSDDALNSSPNDGKKQVDSTKAQSREIDNSEILQKLSENAEREKIEAIQAYEKTYNIVDKYNMYAKIIASEEANLKLYGTYNQDSKTVQDIIRSYTKRLEKAKSDMAEIEPKYKKEMVFNQAFEKFSKEFNGKEEELKTLFNQVSLGRQPMDTDEYRALSSLYSDKCITMPETSELTQIEAHHIINGNNYDIRAELAKTGKSEFADKYDKQFEVLPPLEKECIVYRGRCKHFCNNNRNRIRCRFFFYQILNRKSQIVIR